MLKEKIGVWRLTSVVSGFIGVLLILQPTSAAFEWVLILPVICGFLYALTQVVTRKYCKDEDPLALSFWLTVTFFISGLIGVLVLFSLPTMQDPGFMTRPVILLDWNKTLVLIVIGAASLIMHFALAAAYQNAPGSLVGPLEYLYLPIAVIGGYFFFDEVPKVSALIGIFIIISAGLIIAWREQKLEKQIAAKKKKIKKNEKQIRKLNAKLEKGIVKGTLSPVDIEKLNSKIQKLQESNLKNTQKLNKLTKRK